MEPIITPEQYHLKFCVPFMRKRMRMILLTNGGGPKSRCDQKIVQQKTQQQQTHRHQQAAESNINDSIFGKKGNVRWQTPMDLRPAQLFGSAENTENQDESDEPIEAEYVDDMGGYDSVKTVTVPPSNGKRKGTKHESRLSVTDAETKSNSKKTKSKRKKKDGEMRKN